MTNHFRYDKIIVPAALSAAAAFSAVLIFCGAAGAQIAAPGGTLPVEILMKGRQHMPRPAGAPGAPAIPAGAAKPHLFPGAPASAGTGSIMIVPRGAAAPRYGAPGTAETELAPATPLSYSLPAGQTGTFEATIDRLYMKKDELPENITLAQVAKMKTNPHISTTRADFEKIAKEAFRGSVSTTAWRAAHTSFYKGKDADDDTIYICIAVEYKRDTPHQSFRRDVESLKKYLKKETSDEYVLLENFPFIVVMGSNQVGDYEFSTVKEIASRFKVKLFGAAAAVEPAPIIYPPEKIEVAAAAGNTGEVKLSTPPADAPASTSEATIEKKGGADAPSRKPSATITEDVKRAAKKDTAKPDGGATENEQ